MLVNQMEPPCSSSVVFLVGTGFNKGVHPFNKGVFFR